MKLVPAIKKIISLMRVQPGMLLKCVNVGRPAWGCCLSFAYFFPKYQPGVAYKSVAYKKKVKHS